MNLKNPYRVHVILDPDFGQRLAALPAEEPIWVVASPNNEPTVRELWRQRPAKSHLDGITLFQSYGSSPEHALLDLLDTVDLHHGEHSATPPYSLLEVIGCSTSENIRSALSELGFAVSAATPVGFSAQRLASIA